MVIAEVYSGIVGLVKVYELVMNDLVSSDYVLDWLTNIVLITKHVVKNNNFQISVIMNHNKHYTLIKKQVVDVNANIITVLLYWGVWVFVPITNLINLINNLIKTIYYNQAKFVKVIVNLQT